LVSVGDSVAEVLIRCGKPSYTYSVGEREIVAGESGNTLTKGRSSLEVESDTRKVEVWYYNFGSNDFIYSLYFEGGVLTTIERGGRGK